MVTDIPDGSLHNGHTVLSYRGPMPPAGKNHTYYFLLYKQAIPLGGITITGYVGQHCQERYKNFVTYKKYFNYSRSRRVVLFSI